MAKQEYQVRKLRRYLTFGRLTTVLVMLPGAWSTSLYFDPLGRFPGYRGERVWVIFGIFFLIFGVFLIVISLRWPRRAIWVYHNVAPVATRMVLRMESWSDSNSYTAELRQIGAGNGSPRALEVSVFNPLWEAKQILGKEVVAGVYFDPRSNEPAVIETEHGLLWAGGAKGKPLIKWTGGTSQRLLP